MNKQRCLNEQELILHYYGELARDAWQTHHLVDCSGCKERLAVLQQELARLPNLDHVPHPATDTRMAARVQERLQQKTRRNWLPACGALTATLAALVITINIWSPQPEPQVSQAVTLPLQAAILDEDMPDIDFLEELDLIQNLELLSLIEGV